MHQRLISQGDREYEADLPEPGTLPALSFRPRYLGSVHRYQSAHLGFVNEALNQETPRAVAEATRWPGSLRR